MFVACAARGAGAQGFGPSSPLNGTWVADTRDAFAPQLGTDGTGHWVAVWYTIDGANEVVPGDALVARSSDGGATWSAPELLDTVADADSEERHGQSWESSFSAAGVRLSAPGVFRGKSD